MGNEAKIQNIAHEGLDMTPAEFQQALRILGLTQEGFAQMIGHGARTGQYWATQSVPSSVATLVKLLLKRPELVDVIGEISRERKRAKR
jgi:DNA-binding transcriptional regulator YiaG